VKCWPRATEAGRVAGPAGALVFSLILILIGVREAEAHGGEEHELRPSEVGAGTISGAFGTPEPGSYRLPPLGPAADGRVLTSEGAPARLHELYGDDIVLLSFIYTHCNDAEGCPFATAVLHRLGSRLADEPELLPRLRVLSLSFDPERDTPDAMARYGESFEREGLDWRFLTTESEDMLDPILAAYRQSRIPEVDAAGGETGQFSHLLRVFLIDRARRIRQVYSTELLETEALVADVKTLLLEESPKRRAEDRDLPRKRRSGTLASGPGDDKTGYESADYETHARALTERQGHAADLLARLSPPPLGLPRVPVPPDNPLSAEKVALGRRLFYDRRLSLNDTISCAMCHVPEQGFTSNEMATAVGIEGRTVRRNTPTLYNTAYLDRLFHDGRETSLEHQVWGPLLARNEMGNPSIGSLIEKLRGTGEYAQQFERAFPGRGLAVETIGMALASYERTLVSAGSAFDRHLYGGDAAALSPAAQRGLALFRGRAGCVACHAIGAEQALFTDNALHNTGVGYAAAMGSGGGIAGADEGTLRVQAAPGVHLDVPRSVIAQVSEPAPKDLGRYEITQNPADRWRYRTPTLRNVALSAPYMHDGSLGGLGDVVDFYRRGGIANEGLDPLIRPLSLSVSDAEDLIQFLESLTGGDVSELVADAMAAPVGNRGQER
jgi:cytochrome c peroxidase